MDSLRNNLSENENKIGQLQNTIEELEKATEPQTKDVEGESEHLLKIEKTLEEKAALEIEFDSLTKDLARVKEHLKEVTEEKSDINVQNEMVVAEKKNILKELEEVTQEKEQLRNQMTRLVKSHTLGEEHLATSQTKIDGKFISNCIQQSFQRQPKKILLVIIQSHFVLYKNDQSTFLLELEQKLSAKEETMEVLSRTCNNLREEIASMKTENMNNSSGATEQDDGRSEMMSTSTVSRVEEQNRMRDVEDSFEDRYSKLKLIAIKLKKKCGEQAKTIQELQSSKKVEKLETGTRALGSTLMRQLKLLSRSKLLSKRQKLEKVLHLDHQWRSQESYKNLTKEAYKNLDEEKDVKNALKMESE